MKKIGIGGGQRKNGGRIGELTTTGKKSVLFIRTDWG